MSEELAEAEVISYKFVGQDFVIIRLEDGTELKLQIQCQVAKAKDRKNPDGTPMYAANYNIIPTWRNPAGKKVFLPKSAFGPPQAAQKPKDNRIVS